MAGADQRCAVLLADLQDLAGPAGRGVRDASVRQPGEQGGARGIVGRGDRPQARGKKLGLLRRDTEIEVLARSPFLGRRRKGDEGELSFAQRQPVIVSGHPRLALKRGMDAGSCRGPPVALRAQQTPSAQRCPIDDRGRLARRIRMLKASDDACPGASSL